MHTYKAQVVWERGDQKFVDRLYSRKYVYRFDGGAEVPGSSSPHIVRLPFSDPAGVDPEETFVASLASCHMLTFLGIAADHKFRIDTYEDNAEGIIEKNAAGRLAMTRVTLRPRVTFSGDDLPTTGEIERLHHLAHEECFIANSVRTDVRVEPIL